VDPQLVALGTDGSTEQVGSWVAAPGDEVTLTGTTRYTMQDLARLELRSAGRHPVARLRPALTAGPSAHTEAMDVQWVVFVQIAVAGPLAPPSGSNGN
jgi:hypothetical protein